MSATLFSRWLSKKVTFVYSWAQINLNGVVLTFPPPYAIAADFV